MALLVLFSSFSSCWLADPDCPEGAFSRPAMGDVYTYRASGTLDMPVTHLGLAVDWTIGGRATAAETNERLAFAEGDRLRIRFGAAPVRALSSGAIEVDAVVVQHEVFSPSDGTRLAVADEVLSLSSRSLVQANKRSILRQEDDVWHQMRFTLHDRPAVLATSLLWGRPMVEGERFTATFPHETPLPAPPERAAGNGSTGVEVVRLRGEGEGCRAFVETRTAIEIPNEVQASLEFVRGTPLPVVYEERTVDALGSGLRLELEAYERGVGPELDALAPSAPPSRGLPLGPRDHGFLNATAGVFATGFPTAFRATLEEAEARAWFEAHPSATLDEVLHRLGAPTSTIVDGWELTWSDGPEAALKSEVHRVKGREGDAPAYRVTLSHPEETTREADPRTSAVSLAALAALHARTYGAEAEVLFCSMPDGYCGIGTHDATRRPYLGESLARAFFHPGLVVSVWDGRALQEDSVDPGVLPT